MKSIGQWKNANSGLLALTLVGVGKSTVIPGVLATLATNRKIHVHLYLTLLFLQLREKFLHSQIPRTLTFPTICKCRTIPMTCRKTRKSRLYKHLHRYRSSASFLHFFVSAFIVQWFSEEQEVCPSTPFPWAPVYNAQNCCNIWCGQDPGNDG
jgi:hypothetical protein